MKHEISIVGRRISVSVSDLWDFVTVNGPGPFFGHIDNTGSREVVLIKLDKPLDFGGDLYFLLAAVSRHKEDSALDLRENREIPSNLLAVSQETALSDPATFGWSVYRGTTRGLIGTISLRQH